MADNSLMRVQARLSELTDTITTMADDQAQQQYEQQQWRDQQDARLAAIEAKLGITASVNLGKA